MTGHDDRVLSVASDSHGNLCTSSLDKSVRLWKPTLSSKTENLCHDDQVNFTSVSRNGNYLLTGSRWDFGFMYSCFMYSFFMYSYFMYCYFFLMTHRICTQKTRYIVNVLHLALHQYIQCYLNAQKQIYSILLKLYFGYITDSKVQHPFTY